MGWIIYNLLLILISPLIVLVLLSKARCRRGFIQRLGYVPPRLRAMSQQPIWVHAVSLGEVLTVAPLVKILRASYPHVPLVVSTVTETGREAVEQRLAGVAEHCYLPLDFPWAIGAYIRALRPLAFICVETELWPNLFARLHRDGVPSVLVNGRISSRSFRRYVWIRPFMRRLLAKVSLCLMQSDRDVHRICQLGADPRRVFRMGNMKCDQGLEHDSDDQRFTRETLGVGESEILFVAGSTHPGEEAALLRAYLAIRKEYPQAVLLLAPRHIERADEVERLIRQCGLSVIRRSLMGHGAPVDTAHSSSRVILLDTRGELAAIYALCRIAFVGGTLVPIGGHNLLEPARWGKPVLFGPYVDHCAEIAEALVQAGGGIQVKDESELTMYLRKAICAPHWAEEIGRAARTVVEANRGVVASTARYLETLLADSANVPPMDVAEAPSNASVNARSPIVSKGAPGTSIPVARSAGSR
ncbi:MAG: 3-deoxy-D-manno-octulosonic acid transferase [Nitrospirae bacterium]|nr:MAG: 3-deoxy-D-manno-octulosonic acid transferase [Nitrospirota bacterium]